jgi:hypothetical protein
MNVLIMTFHAYNVAFWHRTPFLLECMRYLNIPVKESELTIYPIHTYLSLGGQSCALSSNSQWHSRQRPDLNVSRVNLSGKKDSYLHGSERRCSALNKSRPSSYCPLLPSHHLYTRTPGPFGVLESFLTLSAIFNRDILLPHVHLITCSYDILPQHEEYGQECESERCGGQQLLC